MLWNPTWSFDNSVWMEMNLTKYFGEMSNITVSLRKTPAQKKFFFKNDIWPYLGRDLKQRKLETELFTTWRTSPSSKKYSRVPSKRTTPPPPPPLIFFQKYSNPPLLLGIPRLLSFLLSQSNWQAICNKK